MKTWIDPEAQLYATNFWNRSGWRALLTAVS
jgi:hypothetical protein